VLAACAVRSGNYGDCCGRTFRRRLASRWSCGGFSIPALCTETSRRLDQQCARRADKREVSLGTRDRIHPVMSNSELRMTDPALGSQRRRISARRDLLRSADSPRAAPHVKTSHGGRWSMGGREGVAATARSSHRQSRLRPFGTALRARIDRGAPTAPNRRGAGRPACPLHAAPSLTPRCRCRSARPSVRCNGRGGAAACGHTAVTRVPGRPRTSARCFGRRRRSEGVSPTAPACSLCGTQHC